MDGTSLTDSVKLDKILNRITGNRVTMMEDIYDDDRVIDISPMAHIKTIIGRLL